MRSLRPASATFAVIAAIVTAQGCDNGAVGVEACRAIESKKCEVIVGCPGSTVVDEGGVSSCKTFYRDQCLFGIADKVDPDPVQLERCLAAIDALASCKEAPTLADCAAAPAVSCPRTADGVTFEGWCLSQTPSDQSACGILLKTEHLDACAFLRPPTSPGTANPATTTGAGGNGGSPSAGGGGSSAGGAGGA
jgi:hypothetical protein